MGMVRLTITHILKFWSTSHTFEISEARQFKFRVPTDTEEYYCKCDRVPGLGTIKKNFQDKKIYKNQDIFRTRITNTPQGRLRIWSGIIV